MTIHRKCCKDDLHEDNVSVQQWILIFDLVVSQCEGFFTMFHQSSHWYMMQFRANKITFILLASSLAYSEASSLFFWVRCLFRAMRRRLCCSTRGVTSLWILGALVLGFLPIRQMTSGYYNENKCGRLSWVMVHDIPIHSNSSSAGKVPKWWASSRPKLHWNQKETSTFYVPT